MITYRKAEQKDKNDFIEMERDFYKYYYDSGFNQYLKPIPSEEISKDVFEKYFEGLLSKENFFFVAEDNGKTIGYILAEIKEVDYKDCYEIKSYGYLDSVFVLEGFRGKGVGKELTNKAIEWLKSNNINICTVGLNTKNYDALKLYEKIGFKDGYIELQKEI